MLLVCFVACRALLFVTALLQATSMEVVLAPSMRLKHSMWVAASTTQIFTKMPI